MTPAQHALQKRLAFLADYARGNAGPEVLAVVVQKWDAADYFETLLDLLWSSSPERIKGWAGNFTKVRVFSGHLGASQVLKQDAVLGNGVGMVLMPEARLPAVSGAFPPLRTKQASAEQLCDFSLLCATGHRPLASLQIHVGNRRLEQFIVDATHVLSESYLLDARFVTSGITVEHLLSPPGLDEGIYHRVIVAENSQDSLICQGRLLMHAMPPPLRPRRISRTPASEPQMEWVSPLRHSANIPPHPQPTTSLNDRFHNAVSHTHRWQRLSGLQHPAGSAQRAGSPPNDPLPGAGQ